jgi:hypothetical protein
MPQAPIIIPIIITGLLVGTIAASKGEMIKRKKLLSISLLSGILNVANAYLLILLAPARSAYQGQFQGQFQSQSTTTGQSTFRYRGGGGNYQLLLLVSSFIVGFLIPLAIIGIGMLYAKRKAGKSFDEGGEDEIDSLKQDSEEEDVENEEDTEELFKNSKKRLNKDSKKDLKQDYDEEF